MSGFLARFAGTVEDLAGVDHSGLAQWIAAIPFEEWPQQHKRADLPLRPAMVSDLSWHGFGEVLDPVLAALMPLFPGCQPHTFLLSAVMPGQAIEPHTDSQAPDWLCRVHVPILSNDESRFIVGGMARFLRPGRAYRVNTEAMHSVENNGATPRVHVMWDVRR